jgi:hypothetical protein
LQINCQQKQANRGIGWLDQGLAKYNETYNLVESDCQLQEDTFNQELLKLHQRCCKKIRKGQNGTLTMSGQKA